jgi:hypothetical protein
METITINSNYLARPTREEDRVSLNEAYNRFTKRKRSLEQYLWEWVNSPGGPNESWVIEYRPTHEIVGHHGVLRYPFTEQGEQVPAGRTENTFVDSRHAKGFYYPGLEKRLLAMMAGKFKYIFTSAPGAGQGAVGLMRQRLGYKPAGKLAWFLLNFDYPFIFRLIKEKLPALRMLASPLAAGLVLLQKILLGLRWPWTRKVQAVPLGWEAAQEVSGFWQEQRQYYGVTADRSAVMLRWRFANNPYYQYHLLRIVRGKEIIGYLIFKEYQTKRFSSPNKVLMVDDLIVKEANAENYFLSLIALKRYLGNRSIMMLAISQEDGFNRGFKRFFGRLGRFFTQPEKDILVWGPGNGFIPWYFTKIAGQDGAQSQ